MAVLLLGGVFGGRAIFGSKAHVENPERYGPALPATGVLAAAGFAAMPWAFGELFSFLLPPVWRGG